MINPKTLRSSLVAALRALPDVVTLVDHQDNIVEYKERGDYFSFIANLKSPCVAVAYMGTTPAGRREALYSHSFALTLRTRSGDPCDLFQAIVNGLENTEIDPLYHQMEMPTLQRRSIAIGDTTSVDYFELTTRFISKGVQ